MRAGVIEVEDKTEKVEKLLRLRFADRANFRHPCDRLLRPAGWPAGSTVFGVANVIGSTTIFAVIGPDRIASGGNLSRVNVRFTDCLKPVRSICGRSIERLESVSGFARI